MVVQQERYRMSMSDAQSPPSNISGRLPQAVMRKDDAGLSREG